MFDLPTEEPVQLAPAKPDGAGCNSTTPGAGAGRQDRPQAPAGPMDLVTPEDLATFIRDPLAFAERAGAPKPESFIKAYLQGLETRLSGVVGAPKAAPQRLATLTADTLLEPVPGEDTEAAIGDRPAGLDLAPRMGPVVVACAVVTAVTAVVQAAVAVTMCLTRHPAA